MKKKYYQQSRHVRRDYSRSKLQNPYRPRQVAFERSRTVRRLKFSGFVFLIILLAIFWWLFFSTTFSINKVSLSGLERVNGGEVENMVWEQAGKSKLWFGSQKNLWLFDEGELKNNLIEKYHFENVDIQKKMFRTLKIISNEREYSYIYSEGDKYYYLDKNGYLAGYINTPEFVDLTTTVSSSTVTSTAITFSQSVFATVKNMNADKYPIVINRGEKKFDGKHLSGSASTTMTIISIWQKIKEANDPDIKINYFLLDNDYNTITAILNSGLTLYFSSINDLDGQIRNLFIIKREKKDNFKNIKKKIDLRYGDKIYLE